MDSDGGGDFNDIDLAHLAVHETGDEAESANQAADNALYDMMYGAPQLHFDRQQPPEDISDLVSLESSGDLYMSAEQSREQSRVHQSSLHMEALVEMSGLGYSEDEQGTSIANRPSISGVPFGNAYFHGQAVVRVGAGAGANYASESEDMFEDLVELSEA